MPRVAVDYRSCNRKAYNLFKKEYFFEDISYEKWMNIIYAFNETFREHLLETGNKEKLPAGFGEFGIVKKKRKKIKVIQGVEHINLPVDWVKTKEKGKLIYNFNHHTNGYFFGWHWFKETCKIKIPDLWFFKPSRVSSRLITHYINTDNKYQDIYKQYNI